jgi:hypothetical protein
VCKTTALNAVLRIASREKSAHDFSEAYDQALTAEKLLKKNRRSPILMLVLTVLFPACAVLFLILKVVGVKKDIVDSRYHNEIPTYGIITYLAAIQLYLTLPQ